MLHSGAATVLHLCGFCCIGPVVLQCCMCGVTVLQCMPIHAAVSTSCAISSVLSLLNVYTEVVSTLLVSDCSTPGYRWTLLPSTRIAVHGPCLLAKESSSQLLNHVTVTVWDPAWCLRLSLAVIRADDNSSQGLGLV